MPDSDRGDEASKSRRAPEVVAPTNRINIALPFSKIQTHEPSKELGELATIVAGLASLVEGLTPGTQSRTLYQQAQRLAQQLR